MGLPPLHTSAVPIMRWWPPSPLQSVGSARSERFDPSHAVLVAPNRSRTPSSVLLFILSLSLSLVFSLQFLQFNFFIFEKKIYNQIKEREKIIIAFLAIVSVCCEYIRNRREKKNFENYPTWLNWRKQDNSKTRIFLYCVCWVVFPIGTSPTLVHSTPRRRTEKPPVSSLWHSYT